MYSSRRVVEGGWYGNNGLSKFQKVLVETKKKLRKKSKKASGLDV